VNKIHLAQLIAVMLVIVGIYLLLKRRWSRFHSVPRLFHARYGQRREFLKLTFDNFPKLIYETTWRQELVPLCRQKRIDGSLVDIEKTVNVLATTLAPQLVFTERRANPEYLFIIEARRPRDHLAAIGRRIASSLRQQMLPVLWHEYRADPKLSWAASHDGAVSSLSMLAVRFPNHRLILVTTGDHLVDPVYPKIRTVPEFETWNEKFLMTPRKEAQFGRTEAGFYNSGFHVVGMGRRGLRQIGEILDGGKILELYHYTRSPPTILPGQPDERWVDPLSPSPAMVRELVARLQAELSSSNFAWMAACAVFPILIPELTEYLGAVLQDDQEHALGSEEGYIELSTLPWFREGAMPEWLRLELVQHISYQLSKNIREALLPVLERAHSETSTEGGSSWPIEAVRI
jgi:hypothetical protein